jgi:hypothetical protein
MSYLLQVLFWCPKCWRAIGYWLFTFSGLMLLLGWRLSYRVDRIGNKTGVLIDLDKIVAGMPLPIPTSSEGFALAAVGVLVGLAFISSARWAQRF